MSIRMNKGSNKTFGRQMIKMENRSLIKQEYKRNLFSYKTVIFFAVVILLTGINFCISYIEKTDFANQLKNPSEDLNVDVVKKLITNYNGFKFFFNFYYISDEFQIGIILIFAWIGIFLSGEPARQRANGYGNLLIVRKGYRNYAGSLFAAQSLYIATVFGIAIIVQLIIAFAVGGTDSLSYKTSDYLCTLPECVLIIIFLYLTVVVYCVSINIITASCFFAIHKVHLIEAIPFLGFAILPTVLIEVLSGISFVPVYLRYIFMPSYYLSYPIRFANVYNKNEALTIALGIIVFVSATGIMYTVSTRKMRKDYL